MSPRRWLISAVLLCASAAFADGTSPVPGQRVPNPPRDQAVSPAAQADEPAAEVRDAVPPADQPPGDDFGTRDGGDTCATATVIPWPLPVGGYTDTGTTVGKTNNYDSGVVSGCPFGGSTARDVVYSITPTTNALVTISLCDGTTFDSKLYVYAGTCTNPPLACNEDTTGCGNGLQSRLPNLALTGGTTYYIIVDGYGTSSGTYTIKVTLGQAEECPANSLLSQAPNLQETTAYVSDADYGPFTVLDNFFNVSGTVCDVHWWGVQAVNTGGQWYQCSENPPLFDITFYPSDPVSFLPVLTSPLCTFTDVIATRTDTTLRPGGWILYRFDAQLPGCCGPIDPAQQYWVAIQGTGDKTCLFLAWTSAVGLDGFALDYLPPDLSQVAADFAWCLTPGGVTGACCNQATGQCVDGVTAADCTAPNGFFPGMTCAQLSPACGQATGACCIFGATCQAVTAAACATLQGTWLGPGTYCNQCPCVVSCPPGGVPEGEPQCFDGYVDTFNYGCYAAAGSETYVNLTTFPVTICGTTGTYTTGGQGLVEADWYQVVLTQTTYLKATMRMEDYGRFFLIDGTNGCSLDYVLAGQVGTIPCVNYTFSRELPPGTYWLVVSAHYGGTPCSTPYTLTVEKETAGACCFADGSCERRSQSVCTDLAGTFVAGVQCDGLQTTEALTATYTVPANSQAIPDWNGAAPQWVTFDITVPLTANFIIENVTVDVVLTHPDISQLYIALLHNDRQVDLAQVDTTTGLGTLCPGAGTPGLNVIFDDAGVTPICSNAVLTGNILPVMPLSLFNNGSTADVWTLGVFDGVTGGTGTIQQWSLHFRRQSCPAATTGACCVHSSCTENMSQADCATAGGVFQGGNSTCSPTNPCPLCAGDADCSGRVNFDDINYFVAALAGGPSGWASYYASQHGGNPPPCTFANNDVNADTRVNFDDIPAFVDKLVSAAQCP